ncbi:MAG: hypothetical protein KGI73_01125 [Patescibacteria group bacterium]|nr:hypothetical protein [Patescibacteria group bacterium]
MGEHITVSSDPLVEAQDRVTRRIIYLNLALQIPGLAPKLLNLIRQQLASLAYGNTIPPTMH